MGLDLFVALEGYVEFLARGCGGQSSGDQILCRAVSTGYGGAGNVGINLLREAIVLRI